MGRGLSRYFIRTFWPQTARLGYSDRLPYMQTTAAYASFLRGGELARLLSVSPAVWHTAVEHLRFCRPVPFSPIPPPDVDIRVYQSDFQYNLELAPRGIKNLVAAIAQRFGQVPYGVHPEISDLLRASGLL